MSKELEPPDTKQCQADVPTGYGFMTLGGQPGKRERCTNKSAVVVTERKAGKDGQHGSMALCGTCLNVFNEQEGTPDVVVGVIP